ncbi:hypothetical protein HZA55_04475 [Candidatus Poribacteria bacterium]|nr:hypothetical protein [Candidatus Poribacteria bacterium]
MSGIGKRFIDAGYKNPKPIIKADNNPIIKYVVEMFPDEKNIIFICNSDHLKNTDLKKILISICPTCKIIEIPPHKLGPVYAVSQIFDSICDNEEVIINYCDFGKYWDYKDFLNHTRDRNADGAIPAYKGFHPHMLGKTNYAFMRSDRQWMLEIQEKKPFTNNRMNEYASDGTYYFKSGELVKKYFKKIMDLKIDINGEYYVSMAYNLLVSDGLKVSIYEIQHMLQWGTPRDLEEYQNWSNYFSSIIKPLNRINHQKNSINLIPLAGRGNRFIQEGYENPKPLIEVSGKPMIIQALNYLPSSEKQILVCLSEHLNNFPLEKEIKKNYPNAKIVSIDKVTEGQACTCAIGLKDENSEAPLLIGACDNGMLWNKDEYEKLLSDTATDIIVWSFKNHPSSEINPQMYGWIKIKDKNQITRVSVKTPISSDPFNDHAIVGTFYFKKVRYFVEAYKMLIKKNIRINNEFYVDSLINEAIGLGLKVKIFQVDHYICWGTPNDLKTYEYWQSFFHKCKWHPYKLELDATIEKNKINELDLKYRTFKQEYK